MKNVVYEHSLLVVVNNLSRCLQIRTCVSTYLKYHEPALGIVKSVYTECNTLLLLHFSISTILLVIASLLYIIVL